MSTLQTFTLRFINPKIELKISMWTVRTHCPYHNFLPGFVSMGKAFVLGEERKLLCLALVKLEAWKCFLKKF